MRRQVDQACERHPNRFDCPDALISFSPSRQAYGLIVHDGGSSSIAIAYCPWCGTRLPRHGESPARPPTP